MALDLTSIKSLLEGQATHFYVAYSGGVDSHVLLHVLHTLRANPQFDCDFELSAIHVNHNLQAQSRQWVKHCEGVCAQLDIPLHVHSVDVDTTAGNSLEAQARDARYTVFKRYLATPSAAVLLAHHRRDQAETLLLQLLRGAGVAGLSSMPVSREIFASSTQTGQLVRPLLHTTQTEITHYAQQHNLQWIDDPSNTDTRFDRNYLRHQVLPQIYPRWPSADATLQRVAEHQAEASKLLEDLARIDLAVIEHDRTSLNIAQLLYLDSLRQKNVLRYWLKYYAQVTVPETQQLNRIVSEVILAKQDALPELVWASNRLRRYQDKIYIQDKNAQPATTDLAQAWDLAQPLQWAASKLTSRQVMGQGISLAKLVDAKLVVNNRQGGESCRPAGRQHTRSLKCLFQEWHVPPWLRSQVALLYADGRLAQVVGFCVCDGFQAKPTEMGVVIESSTMQ